MTTEPTIVGACCGVTAAELSAIEALAYERGRATGLATGDKERHALRAALATYGDHRSHCTFVRRSCTCGYVEAMRTLFHVAPR